MTDKKNNQISGKNGIVPLGYMDCSFKGCVEHTCKVCGAHMKGVWNTQR